MKKTEFLKHEERYSAPLCKLYAFEAKRMLCNSTQVPGGPGEEPGDNNYEGEGDF